MTRRFLIIFFLLSYQAIADFKTIQITKDKKDWALREEFAFFEDLRNEFIIEKIINRTDFFTTINPKKQRFTYPVWVLVQVQNISDETKFIIEDKRIMDYCWVYLVKDGSVLSERKVGRFDIQAISGKYNGIHAQIQIPAGSTVSIFLRTQSSNSINFDYSLMSQTKFIEIDHDRQIFFGLYIGFLLAMIIYNLFLFFSLRDKVYFYYVLCITFTDLLNSVCLFGTFTEYVFTNLYLFSKLQIENLVYSMIPVANILFATEFLAVKKRFAKINWVVYPFVLFNIGFWLLSEIFDLRKIHAPFIGKAILFSNFYIMLLGAFLLYKRQRNSLLFIVSWGILLGSITIQTLYLAGDFESNPILKYAITFGSCIETCLLSIALARRFKDSEEERNIARQEKTSTLNKYNATTEAVLMLAHDIRKPYSQIEIILQLLKHSKNPSETVKACISYIPSIKKSIYLVNSSLNDIVTIGSAHKKQNQSFGIFELIQNSIIATFTGIENSDVAFSYSFACHLSCYGNSGNMQRVIINIISNAANAMKNKGSIHFATDLVWIKDKRFLYVSIKNSNSHIAPEDCAKVFDLFYTKGKTGGSGIGLAIVKKFVELDGGSVECQSFENEVAFILKIPICPQEQIASMPNLPLHTSELKPAILKSEQTDFLHFNDFQTKIMLIDDDEIYHQLLKHVLTPIKNIEIVPSYSVTESFVAILKYKPQIILIDFDIGYDFDGLELCRKIRSMNEYYPLLVLHSNRIFSDHQNLKFRYQIDIILAKPISKESLEQIVLEYQARLTVGTSFGLAKEIIHEKQ